MTQLETLSKLHPDVINDFLLTGKSAAMLPELQRFVMQMQWAVETWEFERNITRASAKLQRRIIAEQRISISQRACKERLYQALDYFNVDVNVKPKVWDLDTANKLEDLALVNIKLKNTREARICMLAANDLRKQAASAINAEDLQPPMFLISPDLKAEDLGFQDKNKKEIARKANEGFYIKLINDLPIEKEQKKRLLTDADIKELEQNEDGVFE